jgi:excinuclease ABC subunit A
MPWEANGRRWHTQDRVDRKGQPAKWDGRMLERVVDFIHEHGDFADTNWNARSIVEITGHKKTDGWFLHAITGEEWLLKLKFRVAKNTFQRDQLVEQLKLVPLNELAELPVYGHEPRVKCKNLRGPFQEVQLQVHTLEEIDKPAFWKFLDAAIGGYDKFTSRVRQRPEDVMPWKVLGQKWHFARRGFPPGKPPKWDVEVLEELCEMLKESAPDAQFLWTNQQLVHVFVPQQRDPWATLVTKRVAHVELALNGPEGRFALGRVRELAADREFQPGAERDTVRLRFVTTGDLDRGDLRRFLTEHLASLGQRKRLVAGATP